MSEEKNNIIDRVGFDDLIETIREKMNTIVRDLEGYQCHEGARIIARELSRFNINVVVKDGGVIYDTSYFKDFSPRSIVDGFDNLPREVQAGIIQELGAGEKKSKLPVLHSWCEYKNRRLRKENIVIDWQGNLSLPQNRGIDNLVIIGSKKDLPHKYISMGINIGKWIIFLTSPLRVIRLKM